jgi:hypothetical protein
MADELVEISDADCTVDGKPDNALAQQPEQTPVSFAPDEASHVTSAQPPGRCERAMSDDHINWCRRERASMAQDLAALNGDLTSHSTKALRLYWGDERIIEHLKKSIAALDAILARHSDA